jgi:hypothetical protein
MELFPVKTYTSSTHINYGMIFIPKKINIGYGLIDVQIELIRK